MTRIKTTHTGSLHRPPELVPMLTAHEAGEEVHGLDGAVQHAIRDSVAAQAAAGIDIINDGEQGKRAFSTYVLERLSGFEPAVTRPRRHMDLEDFPDFAEVLVRSDPSLATQPTMPACTDSISLLDPNAAHRDIAMLGEAAAAAGVTRDRLFMTAVSPGTVAAFMENHYYPTKEMYLGALSDALRDEYRAIVDAGFILQIDAPDIAMRLESRFRGMTIDEIRQDVALSVEAINAATADLPPDRMRLHVCWGNNEVPHIHDVPLREIIDLVARARPSGIAVEAANPRHGHEWTVFKEFKLPDDKYILPGVIDSTTNIVEHPELVAQRINNYTNLLGTDRVVATADCGFGTHAGAVRVARSVSWAKLRAMVEGAEIASQ